MDVNLGFSILALGILLVVLGLFAWRSGGRGAVIAGVCLVSLSLFAEIQPFGDVNRYWGLVVPGAVLVLMLPRLKGGRSARLTEMLLAGGAILAIMASVLFGGDGGDVDKALAVVAALFGMTFIAAASLRLVRLVGNGRSEDTGSRRANEADRLR